MIAMSYEEYEAERKALRELDEVVDSCIVALQEHDTEKLLRVADMSEQRNPNGWLPKMVREYVDVWR